MRLFLSVLAASGCVAGTALAQEDDPRPAKALQDNSFLIEEAYNQEPGVVQHIGSLRRQGGSWFANFTQEWPVVSQTHQFSYSVPYAWLHDDLGGGRGFGDVFLNYRYQAIEESQWMPAFAPRLSLIVPTGNSNIGTGNGSYGWQINLPFSKIISDRVTLHTNAGITSYFDVQGHRPTSFNLGSSAIYAVSRDFNLMFETVGEWTESVDANRDIEREFTLTVSPGFRHAFNLSAGQLVVGAAAPVGLTQGSRPDFGAILYVSFEHDFISKKKAR